MSTIEFRDQREAGYCPECDEEVIAGWDSEKQAVVCLDCGSPKVEV